MKCLDVSNSKFCFPFQNCQNILMYFETTKMKIIIMCVVCVGSTISLAIALKDFGICFFVPYQHTHILAQRNICENISRNLLSTYEFNNCQYTAGLNVDLDPFFELAELMILCTQ